MEPFLWALPFFIMKCKKEINKSNSSRMKFQNLKGCHDQKRSRTMLSLAFLRFMMYPVVFRYFLVLGQAPHSRRYQSLIGYRIECESLKTNWKKCCFFFLSRHLLENYHMDDPTFKGCDRVDSLRGVSIWRTIK